MDRGSVECRRLEENDRQGVYWERTILLELGQKENGEKTCFREYWDTEGLF